MGGKEKPPKGMNPKGMKGNSMERYLELFPPHGDKEELGLGGIERKETPFLPTLDLHGMIREEARIALNDFLRNCRRRGIRRALVVHGKGYHSNGPAVLGNFVRDILRNSKEVEDFGPAPPQKGGSGATWVLLRQRSR